MKREAKPDINQLIKDHVRLTVEVRQLGERIARLEE